MPPAATVAGAPADRRSVLRVEEAGDPELWYGSAGNPCLHARERIAAGGQRVDDLADLVGTLDAWDCALRRLVGVQRLLVLDPGVLVELVLPDLAVQSLQLLPEKGDVLIGEATYALELLCLSAPKRLAVAPLHGDAPSAATDDQGQQ